MGVNYWGVRVGHGGKFADVAHQHGFVAIAWHELGDLLWLADAHDDDKAWDELLARYKDTFQVSGMKASIGAGQVFRFVREIKVGDIVMTPHTARGRVFIGRVTSPFKYVESPIDGCSYRQRHDVQWLMDVPRSELPKELLNSLGSLATVFSLSRVANLVQAVIDGTPTPTQPQTTVKASVSEHILSRLHELHPKQFETFVSSYFTAIGYDARPTQYVGDGGIDVVGTLDAEGLAEVLLRVQVKRTKRNVGIDVVLTTRGALAVDEQGAIVSLGGFTQQAIEEADAPGKKKIILVDGETFVDMLLSHWEDLSDDARRLLGVKLKAEVPLRERFELIAPSVVSNAA